MALADRPPQRLIPDSKRCGVQKLLAKMDTADQSTLAAWIADSSIEASAIARTLNEQGFPLNAQVLRSHRNGLCHCGTR